MSEFDNEFNELVSRLGDMPDPDSFLTLTDLHKLVISLDATSNCIAQIMVKALDSDERTCSIPLKVAELIPELLEQCLEMIIYCEEDDIDD